jgi:hypothetical protein
LDQGSVSKGQLLVGEPGDWGLAKAIAARCRPIRHSVPLLLATEIDPGGDIADRRSRARYAIGLPVRVHVDGSDRSMLAELSDVSATGCFLRGVELALATGPGDRIAFGFVLPSLEVGLVRGRVVRRTPGDGLGVAIDHANTAFDELLGTLAQNGRMQV